VVQAEFLNTLAPACSTNRAQVGISVLIGSHLLRMHFLKGLATVANMGAEVGATTSTFPYTPSMRAYLIATGRAPVARAADEAASKGFLAADEAAEYDEVIEIVSDSVSVAVGQLLN
jgi:homoaconitase/3-isopropylmalate dehydratase large subunit